jgi:hypothetical protein
MGRTFRFAAAGILVAATTAVGLAFLRPTHAQVASSSRAHHPAHHVARKGYSFRLVVSAGAKSCLPYASGRATITKARDNETLKVALQGMPKKTVFALLILQLPNKPFGVGWYQSDITTNAKGIGSATVKGIFTAETFGLSLGGPANGSNAAENLAGKAVNDTNATFHPTLMSHLGVWFDDFHDAQKAGCPATQTPFTGGQHAGIQVLNTGNFPDDAGPLSKVAP